MKINGDHVPGRNAQRVEGIDQLTHRDPFLEGQHLVGILGHQGVDLIEDDGLGLAPGEGCRLTGFLLGADLDRQVAVSQGGGAAGESPLKTVSRSKVRVFAATGWAKAMTEPRNTAKQDNSFVRIVPSSLAYNGHPRFDGHFSLTSF